MCKEPITESKLGTIIMRELPWTRDPVTRRLARRYRDIVKHVNDYWLEMMEFGDCTNAVKYLRTHHSPSGGKERAEAIVVQALQHASAAEEQMLQEIRRLRIAADIGGLPDVREFRDHLGRLHWLGQKETWHYEALLDLLSSILLATLSFQELFAIMKAWPRGTEKSGALRSIGSDLKLERDAKGSWTLWRQPSWRAILMPESMRDGDRTVFQAGSWIEADVLILEEVPVGSRDQVRGAVRQRPDRAAAQHFTGRPPRSHRARVPSGIWGMRGSVIGTALQIAQEIAEGYPLSVMEALEYLFLAELAVHPVIEATFTRFCLSPGPGQYPTDIAGPLVLVVDPFVSPEGLAAFWSEHQEYLYRNQRTEDPDTAFRWRTPQMRVVEAVLQDVKARPLRNESGRRKHTSAHHPSTEIRRRDRVEPLVLPAATFLQEGDHYTLMRWERILRQWKEGFRPEAKLHHDKFVAAGNARHARQKAQDAPEKERARWEAVAQDWAALDALRQEELARGAQETSSVPEPGDG